MEISAGVFVGKVNARVREQLWDRVITATSGGRAIMIRSVRTEQGLDVRVHGHHWSPIDFDGLTLMLRPHEQSSGYSDRDQSGAEKPRTGWSKAARRRKFGPR